MSATESTSARILLLLQSSLLLEPVDVDVDLVSAGLIDSAGFMELFAVLEEEFGVLIGPVDLSLENFRTVRRMAAFVNSKGFQKPS